jgi:predicted Zn-dependent protease
MKKNALILTGSLLILLMLACSRVPMTGRKQFNAVPDNMMLPLSFSSYQEFLKENPPVAASDPRAQEVKRVGSNIRLAVVEYMQKQGLSKQIKDYAWEYNLVENPQVNAWCMPGGKIVFYSGILPLTQDESGLAVVMGHEIAHAIARHGNERLSQQLLLTFGAVSLDVLLKEKPQETRDIFLSLYGVGGTLGTLAYSRQHEYEADKMGLIFMALAGYDPEQAIAFWERMEKASGPAPPEFLSTHPHGSNRIEQLRKLMPEAKKHYKPKRG